MIRLRAITVMGINVFVRSHLCEITGFGTILQSLWEFSSFYFLLEHARSDTIRFSGRTAALCAWINDWELLAFSSVLQSHHSPSPGSQGYALLGSSCTQLPWAQHPAAPAAAGRAFPVPKWCVLHVVLCCAALGRGLPCGHASSLQCAFNKCTCREVGAEGTFLLGTFSSCCVSMDMSWNCYKTLKLRFCTCKRSITAVQRTSVGLELDS